MGYTLKAKKISKETLNIGLSDSKQVCVLKCHYLHKYSPLIFDKGTKETPWSKDSVFNKSCCNNWTSTYKNMNLDTYQIN